MRDGPRLTERARHAQSRHAVGPPGVRGFTCRRPRTRVFRPWSSSATTTPPSPPDKELLTMTVLSRPRHPIVADALVLAGEWCRGQIIDGAPAFGHAVKVALVLGRHVPDATPELVAAVLLHDSQEYAPKNVDLDVLLTVR